MARGREDTRPGLDIHRHTENRPQNTPLTLQEGASKDVLCKSDARLAAWGIYGAEDEPFLLPPGLPSRWCYTIPQAQVRNSEPCAGFCAEPRLSPLPAWPPQPLWPRPTEEYSEISPSPGHPA